MARLPSVYDDGSDFSANQVQLLIKMLEEEKAKRLEAELKVKGYEDKIKEIYKREGNDLCWENIQEIFDLAGLPKKYKFLPSEEEFLNNCKIYFEDCHKQNLRLIWDMKAELEKDNEGVEDPDELLCGSSICD